jgi:nucleotide-binding universal stress UspA family protein
MRRILCPVDFSDFSRRVLRAAAHLADQFGAQLAVVHVNDPFLVNASLAAYGWDLVGDQTRAELHEFVASTNPQIACATSGLTIVVGLGTPAREIVNVARRERSDLIVMGTRGSSHRTLFGSTAARVLRHTNVPVLTLPLSADEPLWCEDRRILGSSEYVAKSPQR